MFNPLKVRLMRAVCGLDVHKDSVYLCILNEDGELIEKVFGVLTFQLQQMRDLLLAHHVDEVSMESTSIYWIPIWRILAPISSCDSSTHISSNSCPGTKAMSLTRNGLPSAR